MLKEILASAISQPMIDIEQGPLTHYVNEVDSISMEGLMDKIRGLLDTSPKGKELEEAMVARQYSRLAGLIRDTLANRKWVEKRFIDGPTTVTVRGNGAYYQIGGKVYTPAQAIGYIEKEYRPVIQVMKKYADELDTAVQEIGSWVQRAIMREDVDADTVDKVVNKAIADFNKLKRPIERVRTPTPVMPGNIFLTVKSREPVSVIEPKVEKISEVPTATVDDIVAVGNWVADTLVKGDLDSYLAPMGLDHSDGSEFNEVLSDINEFAADKFYDTFYHQSLWDMLNPDQDWFNHKAYCEFAIRWCLQSLKSK